MFGEVKVMRVVVDDDIGGKPDQIQEGFHWHVQGFSLLTESTRKSPKGRAGMNLRQQTEL